MLRVLVSLGVLAAAAQAQLIPQCQCSVLNPCIETASNAVQSCADRCQNHVSSLGASYPAARQCIVAHMGQIQNAANCVKRSFGQVCANSPGEMVGRRYPETLQLAAFREVSSMLTRSGLLSQATALLQAGRRAVSCMMRCGQQNSCIKRLGCGLRLPSDNAMVATAKTCAVQSGFNTATVREVCSCLANAGIRQLAPMCPQIVIS